MSKSEFETAFEQHVKTQLEPVLKQYRELIPKASTWAWLAYDMCTALGLSDSDIQQLLGHEAWKVISEWSDLYE